MVTVLPLSTGGFLYAFLDYSIIIKLDVIRNRCFLVLLFML